MKVALILVDIQRDFIPGGAFAVANGDMIIPIVDKLIHLPFDLIVATQDWHPANHGSFALVHGRKTGDVVLLDGIEQILWPVHCVEGTAGAEFAPGWDASRVEKVFHKGTDPNVDSYSTFFDNARRRATGLADYLKSAEVTHVFIAGLTTDYCVKYSVMDARDLGFETYVVTDACKAINLHEGDEARAYTFIEWLGGHLCVADEVPGLLRRLQRDSG